MSSARAPNRLDHLTAVFALAIAACGADPASSAPDPVAPSAARNTSFRAAILLAEGQPITGGARAACTAIVRGEAAAAAGATPEAGLLIEVSQSGDTASGRTGIDGVTAIADRRSGVHVVTLSTADRSVEARFAVALEGRRTELSGALRADTTDLDADGDREEQLLIADVITDGDGDGVSDSGAHGRWIFDATGGIALRHHPATGESEHAVLDAQWQDVAVEFFADLDGDFVPDERDGDRDGDGVPDADETESLPCPSWSHDPLFAETSRHRDFPCARCHGADPLAPLACEDCHDDGGRAPEDLPLVPAGHFERRCEVCHSAAQPWDQAPGPDGEDHLQWPLLGQHLATDCYACHETGNSAPPATCEGCHLADATLDHYRSECQACHAPSGWIPATARHDHFPLNGQHTGLPCQSCHVPPEWRGMSSECASCHAGDAPPRHTPAGFAAQACDTCHATDGWSSYRYPHTQWLLEGQHATVACSRCHEDATTYAGNTQACESCHPTPAFPDHATFGADCERCHAPAAWVPATQNGFDHAIFPLTNAHASAPCSSCHDSGRVPHPPRVCSGCHATDRPQRHAGFFDGECSDCHVTTRWSELPPYEHTAAFPLDGAHLTQPCASCHSTSYQVDPGCVSCHSGDTPPDHYGNTCASCHTTTDWNPTGAMNHHTADPAAFPLSNAHAALLCTQCHTAGYGPLPSTCESCHRNDQPLGHAADGCARCHASGTWLPATQPQPNALHPLIGGHAGRTCVACHGTYTAGAFARPSPAPACTTCHALPAGHLVVGTTPCESCHSQNAWVPAQGGHTGPLIVSSFPYDTWSARWLPVPHHSARQCNSCHTRSAAGDFAFFSCTTSCHRNQADMNDKHNEGVDSGSRMFHWYHFDPNAPNNPPNEGGALWPSGHVGCVNRACHADGNN